MLVPELKKVIANYGAEEKDKIIVELYKSIPKKIKNEGAIDEFILTLTKDAKPKENKKRTISELEADVNYFLSCAYQDLYCSPNNIIPKQERSKWRFKAKGFIKELSCIPADSLEGEKATNLLKDIYEALSYGSNRLLFSNWETFRAVQMSQDEFLDMLIKRKLQSGFNKENLSFSVDLLEAKQDPYGYHETLIKAFTNNLLTDDAKEMALELLKAKRDIYKAKKQDYEIEEMINFLTDIIFDVYVLHGEIDKGVKDYQQNKKEVDQEILEYCLLERIDFFELDEEWIKEYESHLGKIDYRDCLQKEYQEKKNKV